MKQILMITVVVVSTLAYLSPVAGQETVLMAEVSYGELIDKITILQIKSEQIKDNKKLININKELALLEQTLKKHVTLTQELTSLMQKLKTINEKLWNIEDAIRDKERHKKFDAEFIDLARQVYITNDKRSIIKREINSLLGSPIQEEKSYTDYTPETISEQFHLKLL